MIFLCFLQLKTESTASWLLIRCIIYCITYHTHGKVMWINLSLACQNVCVLLAELAALPSAYFLLGPGAFLWKWCKLKSLFAENTAEVFKLIFKVVSRTLCASVVLLWRWGVCWRCRGHLEETAGVRPPASGDLSQPRFYSPVRGRRVLWPFVSQLPPLSLLVHLLPPALQRPAPSFNMARLIFQSISQHPAGWRVPSLQQQQQNHWNSKHMWSSQNRFCLRCRLLILIGSI